MKRDAPAASPGAVVGAAVRQLRKDRGWTLEELSEESGISVTGLSMLENGRTGTVRRGNVAKLARALEVPETDLDPQRCGERVAAEAITLEQRRLVDAVLALPPEDAAEARRVLRALAARRRRKK